MNELVDALEISRSQYDRLLEQFDVLATEYEDAQDELERYRLLSSMLESRLLSADRKAENAQKVQTEFLDTISHELLTPLNGILGMARLLSDIPLPKDAKDSVDIIKSCGESLEDILKSLLDFIYLSRGEIEFINSTFNPAYCIQSLIDEYTPTIYQKGLEITYIPRHQAIDSIEIDKDRFKQIVHVLLSNAVKFTSSGHILIESKIVSIDNSALGTLSNYELHLSVIDTGIGMSSQDIKHIFLPFEQLDSSNNRNYGGIGIGLSLAKEIITQMEGAIVIDSNPGIGSTFLVTLPLHAVHASIKDRSPLALVDAPIVISTLHPPHKNLFTEIFTEIECQVVFEEDISQEQAPDPGTIWIIDYPAHSEQRELYDIKIKNLSSQYAKIVAFIPPGKEVPPQIKLLFDVIVPKPINLKSVMGALEFTSTLIQDTPSDLQPVSQQPPATEEPATQKVLLVESSVINQKILMHLLGMLDIEVETVNSLDEMKTKVTSSRYSHMVINPSIDPTSNLSLIYLILNATSIVDHTRVVAVTGKDSPFREEQFKEAGFHEHVTLPTQLDDFAEALQVKHK